MFLAIPLETRPTWRNPPWATLLLIIVCMLIYWGPQRSEENKTARAQAFYFSSPLPRLELPAYMAHLKTHEPALFQKLGHGGDPTASAALLELMERDDVFAERLNTAADNPQALVSNGAPEFEAWQTARLAYLRLKPVSFTLRWAQSYDTPFLLAPWTWITSAFLHGSPGHLWGNMVFLFLFGFSVEIALGRARFLAFYLLGALGAAAFSAFAYSQSKGYGLGASGAISCVMVLYAMLYKLRSIKFFYLIFFYFNYVRAPALILVPLWIVNELVSWAFVHSNVAYAAHLGGMLTGLVLAVWLPSQKRIDQQLEKAAPAPQQPTAADLAAQAQALVGKMQWVAACVAWQKALRLSPGDFGILRRYYNTARHSRDAAHLKLICHAIFGRQSVQPEMMALQQECWHWCHTSAPQLLLGQEPLLLPMAQRWILGNTQGTSTSAIEGLLRALKPAAVHHGPWLDMVEQHVRCLLRSDQAVYARFWMGVLRQHRPHAAVLTS